MIKALVAILTGVTIVGCVGNYESTYTRQAVVTDVENNSLVTFTDTTGNDWDYYFENETSLKVGDSVKLIMDSMHTDSNIYDDEIKKIVLDK